MARTLLFWVCGGAVCAACGGAPNDSTGSAADSVKRSLSSGAGTAGPDAGRGKSSGNAHGAGSSCKPLDGGRSPCADGEDDDMDDMDHVDGGDMDRGDEDGVHRRDAGKMD